MTMPLYRRTDAQGRATGLDAGCPTKPRLRTGWSRCSARIDRLHRTSVYHRDIAPDNILIEADGHPVLLDFGAARRVIGDLTHSLTAVLKPGYAPIEQYGESPSISSRAPGPTSSRWPACSTWPAPACDPHPRWSVWWPTA
jgi:serine/threonine protein kinase